MDPAQENLEGQHLIQHCVIIQRDKKGYGLTVTGDNPVYVQSVKEDGAAYRTGVQVGDRIIKVNGTVVTHYNHIEVVNLIKSGSYVALTLLGKPPAHQAERHGSPTPPATQSKDSAREVTDERTDSLRRVLAQEHQFYKKTKEEYVKKPSDKLQKELAESTTRIKAFERELSALTQPPIIKTQTSSTGPLSAPPGRTAPINWQSPRLSSRSQSTPTDENFSPPPLDVDSAPLYDNYPVSLARGSASDPPPSIAEPDREPQRPALSPGPSSTSPPQPPERKFNVKGDQLPLPEGPLHLRQHSSPDAFNRPQLNGGSFKKHSLREGGKKQSLEDMTGMAGMHGYTGLSFASPSSSRKNLPPSSTLPRAWNPRGSDSRAFLSDDSSSKGSSNTSSPPPTPTLIEPPEKRNRSNTSEIYADGDEDAQSVSTEGSKLDVPHHQSQVSIISMDEDDFASDDEKIEDHGPFNDLGVLKTKPAHLAVFLHYLISNSDPSSLFFWLVTDSYKEGTPREMKKWSYEIYSTFLAESAPLKVDMDRETVLQPIEDLLGSEDNLKNLFEQARAIAAEEIEELLADFRNKRALGLGSLFGDHQLEDDNMDKVKELQVVEQTLMPHLESVLAELDTNKSAEASQYDRNSAMASALTTFMKQVGLTIKAGNNANILERYSSFTRKENKPLFKIKASKKVRGHHFTSAHYTSLTFCNHCHGLLWGIGDQGYQCQTCEYNVHKVNCFEAIEECPGPGHKKRKEKKTNLATRTPSFMNMMNPRKVSQQGQSPNAHGVTSTVHINLNNNWNHENHYDENESDNGNSEYRKNKSGSFDTDLMGNRDPRDYSGSENEGMSKKKSTSELFLDNKRLLSKPVTRSESMKTPKEISTGLKRPNFGVERARRSVAGPVDAINLDVSNLDTVSEDEEEPDPDMDVDAQPPPWQQVVDKKILKKLKPKAKEIKRQEFIHELIHTERTHVRNLKVLSKVFYRPMTKLDVMSYEQIKELFPNLDELIKIHSSLMKSMMKRQDESEEVISCIGDVMLERFDGDPGLIAKEACAAFCNRQKFALENLKHRQRKEPKLQQLITNCENDPLCRRLRLQDIISSSYQRLTKYPLLLEGIQKNTPNDHSDSKDIERAIQCTKDLLAFVNQSVKDCENQQRLLDLQRKIDKRSLENTNNSTLEEFKNLDFTKKNLVYDGPLTWRISRTKSVDLHVLLLEDLLILLQKQDDKLVLKCLSPTLGGKYQENKNAHSPIIKLNSVLTRNVATDKRAFFLVSTSSVGPQIYELVTATVTDRKNWFKYITDTAEAYKGRERGRRGGVSIGAHRSIEDVGDMTELASRRVAADLKKAEVAEAAKEKAKIEEEDTKEEEEEEEEEEGEKENDSLDEESDEGYTEEVGQEEEEEEEETETTPTQEEVPLPAIVEPPLEQEPPVESESDAESEPETETESVFTAEESKEETETEVPSETWSMLPATAESSPPSDSETDVLSAEDSEAPVAPVLSNRASLAEITNEESVDERCPPANRASMSSESSSSSSNDTLKTRGSLLHMPPDEQDDSASTSSGRSSIMLLELLRSKDGELRKILEEKSRIISELRGGHMTVGASTSESHTNGDSLEARDLVLSAILQANRFTVAVSDVLNPNIDDMTHGGVHLGYDGELTPQQQLVSSTSLLNEQLTTLLGIITERDMARERLRCDLQFANSQIQRLKQGRSSSRRPRELPSQFSLNDDHFSGGFHSDSPRPCSPPSTVDLDSDYARLSEASDYLASEDNMEPVGHSSSFTGYRHRSSLASSGYRSSTASSRQTWRSREETGTGWRRGGGRASNTAYWSDDAEYESQSQI